MCDGECRLRPQVVGIFAGFSILLIVASPFILLAAPCIICVKCDCHSAPHRSRHRSRRRPPPSCLSPALSSADLDSASRQLPPSESGEGHSLPSTPLAAPKNLAPSDSSPGVAAAEDGAAETPGLRRFKNFTDLRNTAENWGVPCRLLIGRTATMTSWTRNRCDTEALSELCLFYNLFTKVRRPGWSFWKGIRLQCSFKSSTDLGDLVSRYNAILDRFWQFLNQMIIRAAKVSDLLLFFGVTKWSSLEASIRRI